MTPPLPCCPSQCVVILQFAIASTTLTPTFPSNSLGVSALAGPNIRLQSDRAVCLSSLLQPSNCCFGHIQRAVVER